MGEEAVLAGLGRADEVAAGIGRVRNLNYLSILLDHSLLALFLTCRSAKYCSEELAIT
jgi:hypothetical protein